MWHGLSGNKSDNTRTHAELCFSNFSLCKTIGSDRNYKSLLLLHPVFLQQTLMTMRHHRSCCWSGFDNIFSFSDLTRARQESLISRSRWRESNRDTRLDFGHEPKQVVAAPAGAFQPLALQKMPRARASRHHIMGVAERPDSKLVESIMLRTNLICEMIVWPFI